MSNILCECTEALARRGYDIQVLCLPRGNQNGRSLYKARSPETDEPCGGEATAANAVLVVNQIVALVKDVSEMD